jgi:uncharacterized membrane protein
MVLVILAIALIGFASGLRAFAGAAVVAWCAYFGCLDLSGTSLSFISSTAAVAALSFLAIGELVGDLLPSAPNRTAPLGLAGRILTGSFCAACLLAASGSSLALSILGGVFAVIGAFVGYEMRVRSVKALNVKDAFVAIPEDLIAVGLSILGVCLVSAT